MVTLMLRRRCFLNFTSHQRVFDTIGPLHGAIGEVCKTNRIGVNGIQDASPLEID